MAIGDLVYDRSICKYGVILEEEEWSLIGQEETEWEYTILYADGSIDTAYEQELWLEGESREKEA